MALEMLTALQGMHMRSTLQGCVKDLNHWPHKPCKGELYDAW